MIDTLERALNVNPVGYRPVQQSYSGFVPPAPNPVVPTRAQGTTIALLPPSIIGAAAAQQQSITANMPRFGIPFLG